MNDKLTFTGGEPFMREDDFLRIQKSNREFIQTLFKDYGDCIISGANTNDPTAGNDLIVSDDGYVYLNGEVLKVDAGTYPFVSTNPYWEYQKVTTYETGGDKVYKDGTARQTWQKNRAVPVNVSSLSNLDAVNGQRYNEPLNNWTNPTDIETDWILQPGAELVYKKDQFGVVWIVGGFRKTTAGSGSTTVLTLPVGFRPTMGVYCSTNGVPDKDAYINTNGAVIIDASDHTDAMFISASFRTD